MYMQTSPAGLVSVLLSVYNGELALNQTIESILGQSYHNIEFVIVNDGSTDSTLSVLEHYQKADKRIKILNKPNTGLIDSLNQGLQMCTGEFVFRQDAEDISHKHRIEYMLDYLAKHKHIDCLVSLSFVVDTSYRIIGISNLLPFKSLDDALRQNQNPFAHGAVAYRRAQVLALGGYPAVLHAEDHALWQRMYKSGLKFHLIRKPLFAYMKSDHGITYANRGVQLRTVLLSKGVSDETVFKKQLLKEQVGQLILDGIPIEITVPSGLTLYYYYLYMRFSLVSFVQIKILIPLVFRKYMVGFNAIRSN